MLPSVVEENPEAWEETRPAVGTDRVLPVTREEWVEIPEELEYQALEVAEEEPRQ